MGNVDRNAPRGPSTQRGERVPELDTVHCLFEEPRLVPLQRRTRMPLACTRGCYGLWQGTKLHMVVDTLGQLLALTVTPAGEQERTQVGALLTDVQTVTSGEVELAYVDQGYTGDTPAMAAAEQGVQLEVVRLPGAKKGFVLLPRRWVVERSFAWLTRFRRLARDYERLPETLAGLHYLAFACLLLSRAAKTFASAEQLLETVCEGRYGRRRAVRHATSAFGR